MPLFGYTGIVHYGFKEIKNPKMINENELAFSAFDLILSIICGIAQMILTLGFYKSVLDTVDGDKPRIETLYNNRKPTLILHYILGSIIIGVGVIVGLIFFIIPGIYLAIRLQFYTYVLLDQEECDCMKALSTSWAMTEGHIINLGSVAGSYPYPGGNVYGGTKAFVSQFSLNLRADLVGKGINVTSVEPGLAETEFSIVRFKGDKEKASQVYQNTRSIKAEDIAETIYWVATRPKNINVNRIEIMAGDQAFNPFNIVKQT